MSVIRNKAGWPGMALDALVLGKGPAARNPVQAGRFVCSGYADGQPDLTFLLAPMLMYSDDGVDESDG